MHDCFVNVCVWWLFCVCGCVSEYSVWRSHPLSVFRASGSLLQVERGLLNNTHTKQSPHTHTHVYKAVMHTSNVHKLKFFIWRKCTQPWSHCIRHATMQYCAISQLTYPNPITNTYKPQLLLSYHNDASTGSNCHDNHKPTHSNQALHNRMPGSGLSQCLQHGYNNITLSCNNNIRVHF